jgi:hypothetical protein
LLLILVYRYIDLIRNNKKIPCFSGSIPEELLFYNIADRFGIADRYIDSCVLVAAASYISVCLGTFPVTAGYGCSLVAEARVCLTVSHSMCLSYS